MTTTVNLGIIATMQNYWWVKYYLQAKGNVLILYRLKILRGCVCVCVCGGGGGVGQLECWIGRGRGGGVSLVRMEETDIC